MTLKIYIEDGEPITMLVKKESSSEREALRAKISLRATSKAMWDGLDAREGEHDE